jgi:hypothetical protein
MLDSGSDEEHEREGADQRKVIIQRCLISGSYTHDSQQQELGCE